jgi:drug/metabolite transporter (DMT)-like permease
MDDQIIWIAVGSAAGILAFFGGIALVVWAGHHGKIEELKLRAEKQRFEHEEQMRALELGQVLPHAELARARSDSIRAWAATTVGVLVPVCMAVTATISTVRIVEPPEYSKSFPILIVIWSLAAAVSLVTVVFSALAIRGRRPPQPPPPKEAKEAKARRTPFEDKPPTEHVKSEA